MGGTAPVLSAFADFFNRFFNPRICIRPEHVITFAGASICLDAILYAICDEGDSILLPAPFWGEFFHSAVSWTFTTVQSLNYIRTSGWAWLTTCSIYRGLWSFYQTPRRCQYHFLRRPTFPFSLIGRYCGRGEKRLLIGAEPRTYQGSIGHQSSQPHRKLLYSIGTPRLNGIL